MTKDELLLILKAISYIDGWVLTKEYLVPEYILHRIDEAVAILEREIKK